MALTDLTRISTSGIATGSTIDSPILRKDVDFRGNQVGVTSVLFDSSERELNFKDNVKLTFGDKTNGDLQVYHNGSDNYIDATTGSLYFRNTLPTNTVFQTGNFLIKNQSNNQNVANFAPGANGGGKLYHENVLRFNTTSSGAVVTGVLTATSFSGPIIGSPISNPSGISTFYDVRVINNLTVEGTTTTLDTNLIGVDRVEVGANSNSIVGVAVTQSGTADIVNLFDGTTEVLTVKDGGFVGIGTDDPAKQVHIEAAEPFLRLENTHTGSKRLDLRVEDSDNHGYISSPQSGQHLKLYGRSAFTIATSSETDEKFRITSGGDVGVGNDSPNCRLAVKDTAEHTAYANATPSVGDCMLQLYNNPANETANDHATIQFGVYGGSHNRVNTISAVAESGGNRKMAFTFCTDEAGNRTEKMRITGDGSVGINSTIPGGVLDLYHATNNTILNVKSGDAGSVINLIDNATRSSIEQHGTTLKIISDTVGTYANSDIRLQVDGATKVKIDSSGQITNTGIETSFVTTMFAANFAKLDIRGTNIANSNHYILSYGAGHANNQEFHMVNTLGSLVFRTGSSSPTERLSINSNGKFCFGTQNTNFADNDGIVSIVNAASSGTENTLLTLWNPTTVVDSRAGIDFLTNAQYGTGRDGAFIRASNDGVTAKAHIQFGTIKDETYVETVRITSGGRLFVNSTAVVNTDDFLTIKRPAGNTSVTSMTLDATTSTGSYANALIFTKAKDYYYNGLIFTSSQGHQGGICGKMTTNGGSTPQIDFRVGGSSFNQSDTLAMTITNSNGRINIGESVQTGTDLTYCRLNIYGQTTQSGTDKNLNLLNVYNYGSGNPGNITGIGLGAGASPDYTKASIAFRRNDSYGRGDLIFCINSAGDSDLVTETDEHLRLTKTGALALGQSTSSDPQENSGHYHQLQIGLGAHFYGRTDDTNIFLGSNAHRYGTAWRYTASTTASLISMGTNIQFSVADAGTALNSISFTEKFKIGGGNNAVEVKNANFSVFATSSSLYGANTSGAKGFYYDKGTASAQSAQPRNTGWSSYYINKHDGDGGSENRYIDFWLNGGQQGNITISGSGLNYGSNSDYRLKKDDVVMTDGISRVKQLRPIRFKWIKDDLDDEGFFAHEAQAVVPIAVDGTKDQVVLQSEVDAGSQRENKSAGEPIYQTMDNSKLVPVLTAALKEAIDRIETLEAKVATLEGS